MTENVKRPLIDDLIRNYNNIKPHLRMILRDYEENKENLNGCAYTRHGAFAAVYYFQCYVPENERVMLAAITNDMLAYWDVDMDTLKQDTLTSMTEADPPMIKNLKELLYREAVGDETDTKGIKDIFPEAASDMPSMIVLTSKHCMCGASYVVDPKILESIGERLNGDFYLLPSSIHELICIPKSTASSEEMAQLVYMVNRQPNLISTEERLSDVVHVYDCQKRELIPCEMDVSKVLGQEKSVGYEKNPDTKQAARRHHLSL